MRQIQQESGLGYLTNVYLTPRGSQGFTDHT